MNTRTLPLVAILMACSTITTIGTDERPWRQLTLIRDGKVDSNWAQIGWGGFAVDDGSLRTDCDEKGMGLLLYKKERFGNCQIRVVYKSKEPKSNAEIGRASCREKVEDRVAHTVKERDK